MKHELSVNQKQAKTTSKTPFFLNSFLFLVAHLGPRDFCTTIWNTTAVRFATPQTTLWGGPGPRFEPGTGGPEALNSKEHPRGCASKTRPSSTLRGLQRGGPPKTHPSSNLRSQWPPKTRPTWNLRSQWPPKTPTSSNLRSHWPPKTCPSCLLSQI